MPSLFICQLNKLDFCYLPCACKWGDQHPAYLTYWGNSLTTAIRNPGSYFLRFPKAILAGKLWLIRHCSCSESPAYATCLTISPHGLRCWHNGQVKGLLRFFAGIRTLLCHEVYLSQSAQLLQSGLPSRPKATDWLTEVRLYGIIKRPISMSQTFQFLQLGWAWNSGSMRRNTQV